MSTKKFCRLYILIRFQDNILLKKIPNDMDIELNVSCPNTEKSLVNNGLSKFINNEREWCIIKLSPICDDKLIDKYYQEGFRQFHCSNTLPIKEGGLSGPLLTVFNNFEVEPKQQPMAYSEFIDAVERGEVREATIQDNKITATDGSGETFSVTGFQYDPRLVQILDENRVRIDVKPPETQSIFTQILVASFPILIILAVAIFFMRQMQGGSGGRGGPMAFGRSKAKLLSEDQIKTTFADVAGVDEAKEDVQELVEFLRDPGKFQRLGGHIPRGILMVGQPGTGKTLLAKAIAGEAKVPFFSISGSDFVEMFVGVGASRGISVYVCAYASNVCNECTHVCAYKNAHFTERVCFDGLPRWP